MSEAGSGAAAFVAAHHGLARTWGDRLAELTHDPDAFLVALRQALSALADPAATELAGRLSPDVANAYVVRAPLLRDLNRPIERALREGSSIPSLQLGQRLSEAEDRDLRQFALPCLRRSLAEDPELTWQLLRRLGRGSEDWIETDRLAELWATGILAEPMRWAELEQLLYSPHVYERRLIGASLAVMSHRLPSRRYAVLGPPPVERAVELIRLTIGDAEVMVQKALSWAVRAWARVDGEAMAALLRAETRIAVTQRDGARAWVIRDSLASQPAQLAAELRGALSGIRRDAQAPSTSIAAAHAAAFTAGLAGTQDTAAMQGERFTRSRP
jgi:hypothetical protein